MDTVFSGLERLHFAITWSGGVKIGDMYLEVRAEEQGGYSIEARITDYGLFALFYPVDDTFTTLVQGPLKLPLRYQVHQKEGWGSETRRLSRYDQQGRLVSYRKNEEPEQSFQLAGKVYNEFAAFFISRVLDYHQNPTLVPAFVDKQRHQVQVRMLSREPRKSIFGEVETLKIQPSLKFKGLYDKDGDTTYWLSADRCRIPVEIDSKIVVGRLTALLVDYENPACDLPAYQQGSEPVEGSER